MIPGDIDLTKNLDFRRTRRKEIPQFPASWKNGGGNNSIDINITDTYLTYNLDSTNYSTSTFTITPQINVDDIDGMIYHWVDYDYTSSFNNYSLITTNSSSITNINNKYGRITVKAEIEPEKDIFGNIIEQEKPLEQICWEKDELANNCKKKPIKQIPWIDDHHRNFSLTRHSTYDDRIPWDAEDNRPKKKESIGDKICYLAGKSSRFISDYFNEDKENLSSYLTNMNWIGVHDAII